IRSDEPVGGRCERAVRRETRSDEGLVRQVVTAEEARDALEERRLRQPAGGRQEAEDRPFDPIGERQRRAPDIARVGEPPAAWLDFAQPTLVRAAELLADER